MRYALPALFALLSLLSCNTETSQELSSGAAQAMDYWNMNRSWPANPIQSKKYTKAFNDRFVQARNTIDLGPWESIGPKNIGGRTLSIAFHPSDTSVIFIGTASGGLWKSETNGLGIEAWERVETGFPAVSVASIAIDPVDPQVMYIGTGEVYNNEAAQPAVYDRLGRGLYGIGILKSIDGGESWFSILDWPEANLSGVSEIIISPDDSNIVLASSSEGLYRSDDAGMNWTQVIDQPMVAQVAFQPENPDLVLATVGGYNTTNTGLYKSFDGGLSFIEMVSFPSFYDGKTRIAFSESNPDKVYASVANTFESVGLFVSEDAGDSWYIENETDVAKYQGWYSHDVAVSPLNEDHIVYVGIDAFVSFDGGENIDQTAIWSSWYFGQVPVGGPEGPGNYVHADIHAAYFSPHKPEHVYLATDGGLFFSADGGLTWSGRNGGLQIQQFYADFSNSQQDEFFAMGGMQDNSTAIYTGEDAWTRVLGGDGMSTGIDPTDDNNLIGSSQRLNLYKSVDRGESFSGLFSASSFSDAAAFNGAFDQFDALPDILYAAGQRLYRSFDYGINWNMVTGEYIYNGAPTVKLVLHPENFEHILASTAPAVNANPKVLFSDDGGVTFTVASGLPDRVFMDFTFDREDNNIAYAVCSGFGSEHLYRSLDGGLNWEAYGEGLPDIPTNSIIIDPLRTNQFYLANDIGVYVSDDKGQSWNPWTEGLPMAIYAMDLSLAAGDKIRLASHGNGVYEAALPDIANDLSGPSKVEKIDLKVWPNPLSASAGMTLNLDPKVSKYLLMDVQGRILLEGSRSVIDFSAYSSGTYLLQIQAEDGSIQTKKIIVN